MYSSDSGSTSTGLTTPVGDEEQYFDVIIIGAGISGINAAYRVQTEGPADFTYSILENREDLGGTWDLFRYPGLRSDSDIFTFGFSWSPWSRGESMAQGDQIRDYLHRSARKEGIDSHIEFSRSVEAADWDSEQKCWNLRVRHGISGDEQRYRSRFILLGTGYYDYQTPMQTVIPGIENFEGKVIHPQFWPEEYDYADKDIVVVGSGATAVTLLPSLARTARRVTQLQRSPGYIFSQPQKSGLAAAAFAYLPSSVAQAVNRCAWVVRTYLVTGFCRRYPEAAKEMIKKEIIQQLPPELQWDPHFKPSYDPWDQRFCACMDGDFFAAIREGKATVVTDTIDNVTADTIELTSGARLKPDVIVTATGLKMKFAGGIKFTIDGDGFQWCDKFAWRTAMVQDVPNLVFMSGYENASWTLGTDVSALLFTRVANTMVSKGCSMVVPRVEDPDMEYHPTTKLSSTYLKNASKVLPKGGTGQWAPKSHYLADLFHARWGDTTTGLVFQ
jgi:cation diffusion facilitator CzcD-associated flavoprotein CzcO